MILSAGTMLQDRYEILEKIGLVAYRLAIPPNLVGVHDVFHVSLLKKCLTNVDAVIDLHQPEIRPNLTCVEKPVKILDEKEKILRTKTISTLKSFGVDRQKEKQHGI